MNVGDAITWQTILTLIAVVGPVGGLWYRLDQQMKKLAADERESRILADAAMRGQLAAFELDVARNYATTTAIRDAIRPLAEQLSDITSRLDRVLEQRAIRN